MLQNNSEKAAQTEKKAVQENSPIPARDPFIEEHKNEVIIRYERCVYENDGVYEDVCEDEDAGINEDVHTCKHAKSEPHPI